MAASTFPHLLGRAQPLTNLGWRGRDAEWLALVCLHTGVFVRSQFCHHYQCSPQTAMRFARRLTAERLGAESPLPGTRTNQKLFHIHGKTLYRTLGIRDVRHRRRTRYFAWKLPIAGLSSCATFVYCDPGLDTTRQLGRWCREHEPLWAALHAAGLEVHVHAVARTRAAEMRNRTFPHESHHDPCSPSTVRQRDQNPHPDRGRPSSPTTRASSGATAASWRRPGPPHPCASG